MASQGQFKEVSVSKETTREGVTSYPLPFSYTGNSFVVVTSELQDIQETKKLSFLKIYIYLFGFALVDDVI